MFIKEIYKNSISLEKKEKQFLKNIQILIHKEAQEMKILKR